MKSILAFLCTYVSREEARAGVFSLSCEAGQKTTHNQTQCCLSDATYLWTGAGGGGLYFFGISCSKQCLYELKYRLHTTVQSQAALTKRQSANCCNQNDTIQHNTPGRQVMWHVPDEALVRRITAHPLNNTYMYILTIRNSQLKSTLYDPTLL